MSTLHPWWRPRAGLQDPGLAAEIAIAIADDRQGRGLGTEEYEISVVPTGGHGLDGGCAPGPQRTACSRM